ncbi:hypothetical protein [Sphaerisporangium dianthi]|uniref:Uncharacterized protein n=1 Tax=Sphaerisporangium dianthi TaxID=1436120 RepID=A0ABV9CEJ2_9ACTN
MSRFPRIREGLAFVPVAGGYVVEGGPRREHLTGRFAREALAFLLPLLDGTRTVEQIGDVLGVPVHRAVDVLARQNLVTFHADPGPHPMRVFIGRSLPAPLADGVWRRLRAARVVVTGGHPTADLLAGLLREAGVGTVGRAGGPADLTVAVLDGPGTPPAPETGAYLPLPAQGPPLPAGMSLPFPAGMPPPFPDGGVASAGITVGDAASAGITAGIAAGVAVRYLGGHRPDGRRIVLDLGMTGAFPSAVTAPAPAKSHLTERRLPMRASPHPLVRTMSRILRGLRSEPLAGPGGAVRAYLLGDLTGGGHRAYAVDPAARALVELPGTPKPDGDHVTLVLTGDLAWPPDATSGTRERLLHGDTWLRERLLHGDLGLRERLLHGDLGLRERLVHGDTGLLIARIAADARPAGWRARTGDMDDHAEVLELDPRRERVTAVVELAPARPSRRRRPPAGRRPGDRNHDAGRPNNLADLTGDAGFSSCVDLTSCAGLTGDGGLSSSAGLAGIVGLALARAEELMPGGRIRCACRPRGAAGWVDEYLRDRETAAAAVLLFTGEPEARLVTKAAVAAGAVRSMAAGAGIACGLLAGLGEHDRRVLYGCALGHPGRIPTTIVR